MTLTSKVQVTIVTFCSIVLLALSTVAAQQTPESSITLRYSTWGTINPVKLATIELFNELHPDINVEYMIRADNEVLLAQMWSQEPPDIIDVHYGQDIDWVYGTGWIRPIDDLVDRDEFDMDVFIPDTLRYAYYNGALMGFPRSGNSSSLGTNFPVYNRTLFDESGVAYPTDDWTFDDLVRMAQKLTHSQGDGTVKQWGLSNEVVRDAFYTWVWSAGGEILTEDEQTSTLLGENEIYALRYLVDLVQVHGVMAPVDIPARFHAEPFAAIRPHASTTGAMSEWPGRFPNLDWSFAPMPRGPNSDSGYAQIGSHIVAISSTTENVEAAWKFIKFLSSKQYQEFEYYEYGVGTPHLIELAQDPRFLFRDQPPWSLESILTAGARPVPRTSAWVEYRSAVRDQVTAAMRGQGDIRTLIEENIDRFNAILQSVSQ